MSTTIYISQDAQGNITVSPSDPTINLSGDRIVIWQNNLTSAVVWRFPGAPSIFTQNEVSHTIDGSGSMTRNVDQNTGKRGTQGYTVALATAKAAVAGSSTSVDIPPVDQPTPGIDIEP